LRIESGGFFAINVANVLERNDIAPAMRAGTLGVNAWYLSHGGRGLERNSADPASGAKISSKEYGYKY
jgi:hypothetical protein